MFQDDEINQFDKEETSDDALDDVSPEDSLDGEDNEWGGIDEDVPQNVDELEPSQPLPIIQEKLDSSTFKS